MAKIKNTGRQPRGFIDEQGGQHTVPPGGEIEINMTPADYEKCEEVLKKEEEMHKDDPAYKDVPPPYEISGGAGGKAPSGEKISVTGERVEHPHNEKPEPHKADEKPKR